MREWALGCSESLAEEEALYLSFYDISSAVAESHKRGETVTRVL